MFIASDKHYWKKYYLKKHYLKMVEHFIGIIMYLLHRFKYWDGVAKTFLFYCSDKRVALNFLNR